MGSSLSLVQFAGLQQARPGLAAADPILGLRAKVFGQPAAATTDLLLRPALPRPILPGPLQRIGTTRTRPAAIGATAVPSVVSKLFYPSAGEVLARAGSRTVTGTGRHPTVLPAALSTAATLTPIRVYQPSVEELPPSSKPKRPARRPEVLLPGPDYDRLGASDGQGPVGTANKVSTDDVQGGHDSQGPAQRRVEALRTDGSGLSGQDRKEILPGSVPDGKVLTAAQAPRDSLPTSTPGSISLPTASLPRDATVTGARIFVSPVPTQTPLAVDALPSVGPASLSTWAVNGRSQRVSPQHAQQAAKSLTRLIQLLDAPGFDYKKAIAALSRLETILTGRATLTSALDRALQKVGFSVVASAALKLHFEQVLQTLLPFALMSRVIDLRGARLAPREMEHALSALLAQLSDPFMVSTSAGMADTGDQSGQRQGGKSQS